MSVAPPARRSSRFLGDGVPFSLFAVLTLVGAVLAITVSAAGWTPQPSDIAVAAALVAAFTVARRVAIEVDVDRSTWRITVTEVPLVIGVYLVPGPVPTLAFAGVVLVARLLRRDSWAKLTVNVACNAILVAVTEIVVRWLDSHLSAAPEWLVLFAAFLVGLGVMSLLGVVAIRLGGGSLASAARLVAHSYVNGMLSAVAGLVGVVLVQSVSWGWLLALMLGGALIALLRVYYGVLREQRDLELLSRVSRTVTGAGRGDQAAVTAGGAASASGPDGSTPDGGDGGGELWLPAAELIREQLNARRVVLHHEAFPDLGVRTVVAGEPLPPTAPRDDLAVLYSDVVADGSQRSVRHVDVATATPDVRAELDLRGANEALVAPLVGAHRLLGVLEVHDLHSRVRGFSTADERLVATLASHLATAMDNRRLLARLRHDAYHDLLTGLRNRLGFREAAREQLPLHRHAAVVVFDLDVLSSVNDALGHAWGDRTVLAAGGRVRAALGDSVLVARLEGDTFAVLLPDVGMEEALATAEEIREVLSRPYPVDKLAVECTALAGVALTSIEPTTDVDVLLQRADVALHAARTGEAKSRAYLPSMGQVFLRRFQLVTQFRSALDDGQIELHYQPKVALATKQVIGVEALVRWNHPEFGRLDPDEWVSIVETTGLVDALTDFVMDKALERCRGWLDTGLRLGVAVNLSVRNLDDTAFPVRVQQTIDRHRVPPELVTFELTESAVMRDPGRALPVLRDLSELGVSLSVDDFGTGYSSLAYLRRLPVDQVKIDKSFVLGMGSDLSDLAVVRAIVDLGHSLGLSVVAEGVEEDAVRDQLTDMGCDVAQGYLFSRPLGERRFDSWLRARTVRVPGLRDELSVPTLVR